MTLWKFNIFASISDSMNAQANNPMNGMSAGEMDEVKRMFLETNPFLLAVTVTVSVLHSVFEMLAFKNGNKYTKKKYKYRVLTPIFFFCHRRHSILEEKG